MITEQFRISNSFLNNVLILTKDVHGNTLIVDEITGVDITVPYDMLEDVIEVLLKMRPEKQT